ncbi:alpha/beta hydrolase [Achromobacter sp. GG226]|uniref:alpha/beta hydrolase n=1 Tax=Verticiella alkaliphila TaxID=2779529 RepID=UPI001C0B0674|nr:alpha/beta hydrolase [Verticiella sp. GG226]
MSPAAPALCRPLPRHRLARRPSRALACTLAALILAVPALTRAGEATPPPYDATAARAAEVASIHARVAAPVTWIVPRDDGWRDWKIFLSVPSGEPPPQGWPVLYVLDGNAVFDVLTPPGPGETAAPLVVVGIGYDIDDTLDGVTRTYDYLPTPSGQAEPDTRSPDARNGGADAFLEAIRTRIQPQVAARVRIDPQRQTLMGHSYGGVFSLHALLTGTDAFQRYVVASPSFWYRSPWLPERVATFLAGSPTPHPVHFTVGSEERSRRAPPGLPGVREAAAAFAAQWPQVHLTVFEGLGHGAAMPAAIDPAIALATAP